MKIPRHPKEKIIYIFDFQERRFCLAYYHDKKYGLCDIPSPRNTNGLIEAVTNTLHVLEEFGEEYWEKFENGDLELKDMPKNKLEPIYPIKFLAEEELIDDVKNSKIIDVAKA